MPHLLVFFITFSHLLLAAPVQRPHVSVELVHEFESLSPSKNNALGVRYVLEPGWHVYWLNPGDSGEPPRHTWDSSPKGGFSETQWPSPKRIPVGPLVNFGYSEQVLFISEFQAPKAGSIDLSVEARWLVCKEECIPGNASLKRTLKVTANPTPSKWAPLFEQTRAQLPAVETTMGTVAFGDRQATLTFSHPRLNGLEIESAAFFPQSEILLVNRANQTFTHSGNRLDLNFEKHERSGQAQTLDGVVVVESQGERFALSVKGAPESSSPSVALILVFAFLGGCLLNLMPCVFPILFIKIFGFLELSKEGESPLLHSLSYSVGILVSFWILAGSLLALKAGGEQIGWGFQLQSPIFIASLCFIFFALALSFLGYFEIDGFADVGSRLTEKGGLIGSFFTGVLATIVATPCTAPFMGTALGFALTQPAWIALLVFTFLGLGMALPYAALSAWPTLLNRLPKPGLWMITLRQLLAFPLFATLAWLIFVFSTQTNPAATFRLMLGLVAFSLGLWFWGRRLRTFWRVFLVLVFLALGFGASITALPKPQAQEEANHTSNEAFTRERFETVLASGTPVFINFTASWCITCQVNEQVVFSRSDVQAAFEASGTHVFIADWTNQNPEISTFLSELGREGVPVYALYSGKQGEPPRLLPQILTPAIVKNALSELK